MPELVSDVLEVVCEFAESIPELAVLRLVSRPWHDAVRATLAFLNGRDDSVVDDKHGPVARYYVAPEATHWLGDEPHGWALARYCAIIFQASLRSLTVRGRTPGEAGATLCSMNNRSDLPDHVSFPCLEHVHLGNEVPTGADIGLVLRPDVSPVLRRVTMSHAIVSAGVGFLANRPPSLTELTGWPVGFEQRSIRRLLERHATTLTSVSLQGVDAFEPALSALCECRVLTKMDLRCASHTPQGGACAELARKIATRGALPPRLEELCVTFTVLRQHSDAGLVQLGEGIERRSEVTSMRNLLLSVHEAPTSDCLACILPFRDSLEELMLQHDEVGTAFFQATPTPSGALLTFPKLESFQVASSMFVSDIPLQLAADVPERFPVLSHICTDREIRADAPLPRTLVRLELCEIHSSLPRLLARLSRTQRLRELGLPWYGGPGPPLLLAQCCPELEVFAGALDTIGSAPPPALLKAVLGIATMEEWQRFVLLLEAGAFRRLQSLSLCIQFDSNVIAEAILSCVLAGCPSLTQLDISATCIGLPGMAPLPTGIRLGLDVRVLTDRSADALRRLHRMFIVDPARFRR